MNLELIKHSVDTYEFNSPEEETETILKQIRDAKKELELIKRSLHSGISFMHRTGDDEGLQEAYTDLDAFLNPEIFEPTHSSDPAVDYEKEYTSKEPDLDFHGHEIDYKKRYEAILKIVDNHPSMRDFDADSLADGCYNAGLNDALDPLVQASIITRNKALSDGMATIEADGEVTYK